MDSQSYCHHIYGDCSSYALICSGLRGLYFHDINADNTNSATLASIRIEERDSMSARDIYGAGSLPLQAQRGDGTTTNPIDFNGVVEQYDIHYIDTQSGTGALTQAIYETAAPVIPVTDGMTLDATWSDASTDYTDFSSISKASAKVEATFNSTDSGIILESGGTGSGLGLYIYDGILYFQCGVGSTYTSTSTTCLVTWSIPNTDDVTYLIEFSFDTAVDELGALYIDGIEVGRDSVDHSSGSGSDLGGIYDVHGSSVVANPAGWSTSNSGLFTGTILNCEIFIDESTGF